MRLVAHLAAAAALMAATTPHTPAPPALERIVANDNRASAGTLTDGVLTLHLEVREGEWHPDGDSMPGVPVRAFAEVGRRAMVPAPLVRVPTGTEVHATIHNTDERDTLLVRGLSAHDAMSDTVRIAPGATRVIRFVAGAPGTYHWSAIASWATPVERSTRDALLSGAFVVDERGATSPPRDRVFVISLWSKQPRGGIVAR